MSDQSFADGDSIFTAVIDYLETRPDVDPKRIAIMGRSFGGYWAAKMAHVEANRLRAAVVWGGGIHNFFQEDWLRESTNAESYLMDHDLARCRLFGVARSTSYPSHGPSCRCKTRAGSTNRPVRCCSSTAKKICRRRSPICIFCWSTARRNRRGFSPAVTWVKRLRLFPLSSIG